MTRILRRKMARMILCVIFLLFKTLSCQKTVKVGVALTSSPNHWSYSIEALGGAINLAFEDCKQNNLLGKTYNIRSFFLF